MRFRFLSLTIALFGCSPSTQPDYYPLHIGDEWSWLVKVVMSDGKVMEGSLYDKTEATVEKNGKTYFRMRFWSEGPPKNIEKTNLKRKGEKGVYAINGRDENASEEFEFGLPLYTGATWQHGKGENTATVLGLERVEIDGKTYENCYHVREVNADGSFSEDTWQTPKVGEIKSYSVFPTGITVSATLKEFKPGK